MFLYAVGVAAGVLILEERENCRKLALPFWAIQIPVIYTPWLAFEFSSGARFNIVLDQAASLNFTWGVGSQFWFYLNTESPIALGVNIVAIAVFWVLLDSIDLPANDAGD